MKFFIHKIEVGKVRKTASPELGVMRERMPDTGYWVLVAGLSIPCQQSSINLKS